VDTPAWLMRTFEQNCVESDNDLGGRLGVHLDRSRRRLLFTIAAVESSVLFAAALAARGYDSETLAPVARLCALIALTAAAMGIRNATVRRLAVSDLTTTVLTLTLTGLGADSRLAGGPNPLALDGKGFVKTGAALTVDELVAA